MRIYWNMATGTHETHLTKMRRTHKDAAFWIEYGLVMLTAVIIGLL